jgi:hypothetical protein
VSARRRSVRARACHAATLSRGFAQFRREASGRKGPRSVEAIHMGKAIGLLIESSRSGWPSRSTRRGPDHAFGGRSPR